MSRRLDRCGQEGHDRRADRLSQEVAGIKERVLPRVILIGKMVVVVIARSWSLDDSAPGMDGARLAGGRARSEAPSDQDRRVVRFFLTLFLFALYITTLRFHAHVHLGNHLISCTTPQIK